MEYHKTMTNKIMWWDDMTMTLLKNLFFIKNKINNNYLKKL